MDHQPFKFGFNSINKEWALKVGKEKFLDHFKDIYPGADLEAEWNKISPPEAESDQISPHEPEPEQISCPEAESDQIPTPKKEKK